MKNRRVFFRSAMHLAAWIPATWLMADAWLGHLTANPIQEATKRLGGTAISLLVLSLACTPLSTLFGVREATWARRSLGLYAFWYAAAHFILFAGIDYQFDLKFLWADVGKKPYIWVGLAAGSILLALAITSFPWWMKRLGKNWKRLHRLIYLAAPLTVLHFAWSRKGNLFSLGGDMLQPFLYGLVVVLLLALRLPHVKQMFVARLNLRR